MRCTGVRAAKEPGPPRERSVRPTHRKHWMRQKAGRQLVSPLVAAALVGFPATAPQRVEKTKMALRVLHLRHPDVQWHEPPIRADFTDDRIADLAIAGVSPERLVVALIIGPVDTGSRT